MKPIVSIIVLNDNGREGTLACLHSLEHLVYRPLQIVVVDNHSSDGSVEAIRMAFPDVTLIQAGASLGFANGNNAGIQYALEKATDYILLLNNDSVVAPDFLNPLVEIMEQDPTVGVTGPTIYSFSAPETIRSAGGAIDWARGTTRMIGLNEKDQAQYGLQPRPVDFVTGCALMTRRSVWEQVGLLDERFFMYYEEAEWCVRASRAGHRILHVPTAMIWHKISVEERAMSPLTYYYMTRDRLLFLHKTQAGRLAWARIFLENGRTLVSWSVRSRSQDCPQLRRLMLRAWRDYSRGHFGPMVV